MTETARYPRPALGHSVTDMAAGDVSADVRAKWQSLKNQLVSDAEQEAKAQAAEAG